MNNSWSLTRELVVRNWTLDGFVNKFIFYFSLQIT